VCPTRPGRRSRGLAPYILAVRFTAEHRFPGPPAAVAAVLADPGFYRELELPDLRLIEVRGVSTGAPGAGPRTARAPATPSRERGLFLRYEFTGNLDSMALRLLGGDRLTWTQEVVLVGESSGWITFAAEADPRRLHGRADFVLERDDAQKADAAGAEGSTESTLRRLEGELVVAVPVVGSMAERRVVPGVLTRLDVEARGVSRRLGPPRQDGGGTRIRS
jgi:Protein of unknown function (DUF2505)